jgi:hypothetical protein
MNQKELLVLSIGIFMTIVAWMVIDIYHLQSRPPNNKDIKAVGSLQFKVDEKVFNLLKQKQD